MTRLPKQREQADPDPKESRLPFLSGTPDLAALLDEASLSTVAKAQEVVELRRDFAARSGQRSHDSAAEAARAGRSGSEGIAFAVPVGNSRQERQTRFL